MISDKDFSSCLFAARIERPGVIESPGDFDNDRNKQLTGLGIRVFVPRKRSHAEGVGCLECGHGVFWFQMS